MDRCNRCGRQATAHCGKCKKVYYCSPTCQKADWKVHKPACAIFSSGPDADAAVPAGSYAGTFRWFTQTEFQALPEWQNEAVDLTSGWDSYISSRWHDGMSDSDDDSGSEGNGADDSDSDGDAKARGVGGGAEGGSDGEAGGKKGAKGEAVQKEEAKKHVIDISTVDGLSFPVTFLHAFREALQREPSLLKTFRGSTMPLHVVALGCSERAEEHILRHTNYFAEIGNMMPLRQVNLWLVGPEMSIQGHMKGSMLRPAMSASCYRGTAAEFIQERFPEGQEPAGMVVLIAYNTGMASGDDALKASWAADLHTILSRGWLAVFTCASDHTDLVRERVVMEQQLRARYVLYPRKNPFSAMTAMHPPGQRDTGWYAANAFLYAVQGFQKALDSSPSDASNAVNEATTTTTITANTGAATCTSASTPPSTTNKGRSEAGKTSESSSGSEAAAGPRSAATTNTAVAAAALTGLCSPAAGVAAVKGSSRGDESAGTSTPSGQVASAASVALRHTHGSSISNAAITSRSGMNEEALQSGPQPQPRNQASMQGQVQISTGPQAEAAQQQPGVHAQAGVGVGINGAAAVPASAAAGASNQAALGLQAVTSIAAVDASVSVAAHVAARGLGAVEDHGYGCDSLLDELD